MRPLKSTCYTIFKSFYDFYKVDGAFHSDELHETADENGVELHLTNMAVTKPKAKLPVSEFEIDKKTNIITMCPDGYAPTRAGVKYDAKGRYPHTLMRRVTIRNPFQIFVVATDQKRRPALRWRGVYFNPNRVMQVQPLVSIVVNMAQLSLFSLSKDLRLVELQAMPVSLFRSQPPVIVLKCEHQIAVNKPPLSDRTIPLIFGDRFIYIRPVPEAARIMLKHRYVPFALRFCFSSIFPK